MALPVPGWLPAATTVELAGIGPVAVRDSGPGPASTVVLLHGWTVSADLNWYRCYEPLVGAGHRVVAWDQRGHGNTPRRGVFRLADCAADTVGLTTALGLDRFTLVGYSMGGCVAQLVARDHAPRLEGLVLCATARRFRGRGRERARFALLPPLSRAARAAPPQARRRVFGHLLGRRSLTGDIGPWALGELAKADPQALLEAGTELYAFDSSPWLATITTPTAVVVTERDTTVPARRQHRLAAHIPGATVHGVPGGHAVVVGSPDRFVGPLLSAIASVNGRAGATVATLLAPGVRPSPGQAD